MQSSPPCPSITDDSKLILPEAHSQFLKTLIWRKQFDPRKAATEKHDPVYDTVGHVIGMDKKRRLVTYNMYGGLDNQAVHIHLMAILMKGIRGSRQIPPLASGIDGTSN